MRAAPDEPPFRVVLSMIVRNESMTIFRCLAAALPFVDGFVIVDTGSTDDTEAVAWNAVRNWHEPEVPGLILREEWQDFGHNRTSAAEHARAWAAEQGYCPGSTYLLLLDADMVLEGDPERFREALLTEPYYQLVQETPDRQFQWTNTRLVRLSHAWRAVGRTHEYWSPTPDVLARPSTLLPEAAGRLRIIDHADGGSRAKKYERDIALLERTLAESPQDARAWFYLGQSHYQLGSYAEAAVSYRRRTEFPEHPEERWYALYMLGRAELNRGRDAVGLLTLLSAYEERPARAEPLMALSRAFTDDGRHHLALLFARAAEGKEPDPKMLFLDRTEALYWPRFQIARSLAWTGDEPDQFLITNERLLADRSAPDSFHGGALLNSRFGAFCLTRRYGLTPRVLAVTDPELLCPDRPILGASTPNTTHYHHKNPSLFHVKGDVYAHLNLVNYRHERGVVFEPEDPDHVSRTRGVVAPLFCDESPYAVDTERALEVRPEWPEGWPDMATFRIRGLEDVRVVEWGSDVRVFTATSSHATGSPQVLAGELRMDGGAQSLTELVWLDRGVPRNRVTEKNWLPWPYHDDLYYIYSWDPFTLLEDREGNGLCTTVVETPAPIRADTWRGSAPPVRLPSGRFVAVIHQVLQMEDRRVYLHRFVELTPPGPACCILRYSPPWSVDPSWPGRELHVEYVTSILPDRGHLLLGYGEEERLAKLVVLPWSAVEDLLAYPHKESP